MAEGGVVLVLPPLTVAALQSEAAEFADIESRHPEPSLYGVDNGKTIGTYLEAKFRTYLRQRYSFAEGNAAKGIDFPDLRVDVKTTSLAQPQSSCPFTSARQKIFGLGYSLLVFVYDKADDPATQTAVLNVVHAVFVDASRTGDYTMTRRLKQMLEDQADADDIVGFLFDRYLPVEEIEAHSIADEILKAGSLVQGYLTICNALQWRLQYARVIREADNVDGIARLR